MQKLKHIKYQLTQLLPPRMHTDACKSPELSFKTNRRQLALVSLTINLLALALPIMTLQVYDRILISQSYATLHVLAFAVVIAVILDTVLRLARHYVVDWAGAAHEHAVSCNALRHILGAELSFIEANGVGTHMQRMSDIGKLRDFYSGQALITFIDLPFILIFLTLIGYLAGVLVLIPLAILSACAIFVWHLGGALHDGFQAREASDRRRLNFIIETLEGIHTVKSMALEPFFQRRYERHQLDSSRSNHALSRLNLQGMNIASIFTQAMIIGIVGFGAPLAMDGYMTMGSLIACVLLSGRIMMPLQRALGLWGRYQDFKIAQDNVNKTFEIPILERLDPEGLSKRGGSLEVKGMSFGYDDDLIFSNAELKLSRGECVALSGDRTSGKTTLLKLISGLYSPNGGRILVDGVVATKFPARELVKHVGYMQMEGVIFRGTIKENISAFGERSDEEVQEIVDLLDLDVEIKKLPAGYETKLEGSPSDAIAPGLRQRIAIARTLAPKPRIILFDNAGLALDNESYNKVYRLLARLKGKATIIIVSDDRNILRLADKEYMIWGRSLVERKKSNEQMQHDIHTYRELYL